MQKKSLTKSYMFSAVCFGLAALLFGAAVPAQIGVLLVMRLAALGCAVLGALMAVLALKGMAPKLSVNEFGTPLQSTVQRAQVPVLPADLAPADACLGSLRGAVRALPGFLPAFEEPVCHWQVERMGLALEKILNCCEMGPDPAAALGFAVGYLPSVMQYLAACAAEGCPKDALRTLAGIALACEKQQDALAEGRTVDFKMEYDSLRRDLEQAAFSWNATPKN